MCNFVALEDNVKYIEYAGRDLKAEYAEILNNFDNDTFKLLDNITKEYILIMLFFSFLHYLRR